MVTLVVLGLTLGAPTLEVDRVEGPSKEPYDVHILVSGVSTASTLEIERLPVVQQVRVLNAPSVTRGFTTSVTDLYLLGEEPLVVRLSMGPASIGAFNLATLRVPLNEQKTTWWQRGVGITLLEDSTAGRGAVNSEVSAKVRAHTSTPVRFGLDPDSDTSRAALSACTKERPFRVVLDPGHHPRERRGSTPLRGISEVQLNDKLAARVHAKVRRLPGVTSVLTRTPTETMTLQERLNRIRSLKPNFVLSLHHDNVRRSRQQTVQWAGRKVRACADRSGFSMYIPMVGEHAQSSYQAARFLAGELLASGREIGRFFEAGEADLGIYDGDLLLLIDYAPAPTVLLESGFLCNPEEEQRITTPRLADAHAELITRALTSYVLLTHCSDLRMKSPYLEALPDFEAEMPPSE